MRKELKKHIKQMNPQEIVTVVNMVESATRGMCKETIRTSYHCKERMSKRLGKVDNSILMDVLSHYEVIEYKQVFDGAYMIDKRVVLRSTKAYKDEYNYCIVFSLLKKSVVTYWKNKTYNTHENVDLSKYNVNMKVY